MTEKITIGVVNFNGKDTLPETLQSVQALEYPKFDVIVVDNNSTDGSREWAQEYFPQFRYIVLNTNVGLPGARNVILRDAESDYVFIMDNDIVLASDVLNKLLSVMKTVTGAAVCHPEICDPDDPVAYHYNGGWIHYLCAFISRSDPDSFQERSDYEIYDSISGAALLIDRNIALKLGGFDEDYFFNWEDGDFTSRVTLADYLCLNVPSAVVRHRSKPRGMSKVFYQTRNRWFFIFKLYSWRTIFLSVPAFIFFELSQVSFLFMKGAGREYLRGNWAAFCHLSDILKKRRFFQQLKVKSDKDWLRSGELYVPGPFLRTSFFKVLKDIYENFFNIYWGIIRHFC